LFGETAKEELTETTALDFKFGIKQREDKSVKLNVYELGGGRVLANLLQTVFYGSALTSTAIVLCIDLSKPGNSIDSILFWIKMIRDITLAIVSEMKERDPSSLLGV
jgi:hypothetical protein